VLEHAKQRLHTIIEQHNKQEKESAGG
jgi:hypothetical protein